MKLADFIGDLIATLAFSALAYQALRYVAALDRAFSDLQ